MTTAFPALEMRKFENFIKNRGVTTVDGLEKPEQGILVDKVLLDKYQNQERPKDLLDLVTVIEILTQSGGYEVADFTKETLDVLHHSQMELGDSTTIPENFKDFTKVAFDSKTFAGAIKFGVEQLSDNQYNLNDFLLPKIIKMERRTKIREIGKVLQTATPKTAATLDELKDTINLLNPEREVSVVVTQSLFNTLEKLKDSTGKQLLKTNKLLGTSETFYVDHFLVVDDNTLGNKGDKLAFIGDLKNFVTIFDRMKTTLRWIELPGVYGEQLHVYTRFDTKKIISEVGYLVTWS